MNIRQQARYLYRRFIGYPVLRLNMRVYLWWMRPACTPEGLREVADQVDARIDLYCVETGLIGTPLEKKP